MPRANPERDRAIAAALAGGAAARAVAAQHNLTVSSVYRAAQRAEAFQAQAAAPDQRRPALARARAGGPNFAGRARSGLRHYGGTIDDDYDRVFRTLRQRVALYREMGDDPVCAAVLQACKMTLRRTSWYAETDGETDADKQARDFLDQAWDDMSQAGTDTIDQASNMLQYGFYPAELVYKRRLGPRLEGGSKYADGRIGWRRWTFMAPESLSPSGEWEFDAQGGLVGINQTAPPDYQPVTIPITKAILFRTTAEKNNPEGRSLFRAMYQPWYYKHNLEEIEAISAERMGAGFPVAYLGKGTATSGENTDDLVDWQNIIANVRADEMMGLVIPHPKQTADGEGVLFELVSPPAKGAVDFHQVISRHEQRMAMVGLAQFIHLGMNQVGARSLGETTQDFFTLAVSAWADAIADTINRYAVERLMALNYFPGLTAMPRLSHETVAQTRLDEVADYINKLTGSQLITPSEDLERFLLELADLPVTPQLTEIWEQKAKVRDAGLAALADPAAHAGGANGTPAAAPQQDARNRAAPAGHDRDDDLAAALREATEVLRVAQRAEEFAARGAAAGEMEIDDVKAEAFLARMEALLARLPAPAAAAPAMPTIKFEHGAVEIPEQPAPIVHVQAPDMTPVAEAMRAVAGAQAAQTERLAEAQSAAAERMTAAVQAQTERPIVINVEPPVINVPAPEVTVNVPPQPPAVVSVDVGPIAGAIREAAQMDETVELEHGDDGRVKKAIKRRRKKA